MQALRASLLALALTACGSGGGGGGDAGSDGAAGMTCADLTAAYSASFRAAQMCDIAISSQQCTAIRPTTINCGCTGAVQASAAQHLDDLRAQWTLEKCLALCPAIACRMVTGGMCMAQATGDGACVDLP